MRCYINKERQSSLVRQLYWLFTLYVDKIETRSNTSQNLYRVEVVLKYLSLLRYATMLGDDISCQSHILLALRDTQRILLIEIFNLQT